MKVAIALVLMSLVSVNNVCASDAKKNKRETQWFLETIANLAHGEALCFLLPNDKKDLINDCNVINGESKPVTVNDSKKTLQLPFKPTTSNKNYTGSRFVYGTPYTTIYKKIPSKL